MVVHKNSWRMQLEQLRLDELMEIRERADRLIGEKLVSEKKALQEKLWAIERYEARMVENPQTERRQKSKTKRVAPKYRDPETGMTWAGRGQMPRWMTRLVAQGAKPEQFLIADENRR